MSWVISWGIAAGLLLSYKRIYNPTGEKLQKNETLIPGELTAHARVPIPGGSTADSLRRNGFRSRGESFVGLAVFGRHAGLTPSNYAAAIPALPVSMLVDLTPWQHISQLFGRLCLRSDNSNSPPAGTRLTHAALARLAPVASGATGRATAIQVGADGIEPPVGTMAADTSRRDSSSSHQLVRRRWLVECSPAALRPHPARRESSPRPESIRSPLAHGTTGLCGTRLDRLLWL